ALAEGQPEGLSTAEDSATGIGDSRTGRRVDTLRNAGILDKQSAVVDAEGTGIEAALIGFATLQAFALQVEPVASRGGIAAHGKRLVGVDKADVIDVLAETLDRAQHGRGRLGDVNGLIDQ